MNTIDTNDTAKMKSVKMTKIHDRITLSLNGQTPQIQYVSIGNAKSDLATSNNNEWLEKKK